LRDFAPTTLRKNSYESNQQSGHIDTFLFNHFSFYCSLARLPSTHVCKFFRKVVGAKSRSFCSPYHTAHVGNSICETYPRMIGQGLNEAACILGSMLSSLMGLPNQAWVSLANVAPTWHAASATCHYESVRSIF